eukprot:g11276.t2
MHAEDKAVSEGWLPFLGRIPEALLGQVELAGGSPGSFIAQRVFRHKISKLSYQQRFSQVLIVQIAASLAWGYFHGASWALFGVGLTPAAMFAGTARRISIIKDRKSRGYGSAWQKPVDVSAPASKRGNTRTRSKAAYYK